MVWGLALRRPDPLPSPLGHRTGTSRGQGGVQGAPGVSALRDRGPWQLWGGGGGAGRAGCPGALRGVGAQTEEWLPPPRGFPTGFPGLPEAGSGGGVFGAGSACPLLPPRGPSSSRRAGPGVLGSRPTSAPRPPRGALRAGAGAEAVCAGRPGASPRGQASPIHRPIRRPRPLPQPVSSWASPALWSPLLCARRSLPGQQDGPPRRGCQARNSPRGHVSRGPRARPLRLKPC